MTHPHVQRRRLLVRARGFGAALAAVLTTGPAWAVETEVRNDSLNPPATGVVVGDFNVGEMAAVTLTSPCDGSIVAVQILWLSALGGATDTLEENIWIFNVATPSGSNSQPGPVLLQLQGPVLSPGYMNEFRYVDEAGTVPIDVPVTNGQQFLLALQFGTATDIYNGSASVVRDQNGCQSGKNWLYGNIGSGTRWYNFCTPPLSLQGDLVIRAIVDCQGAGQTFFQGQTCTQVTCPAPTGACCNGTGGCFDGQEELFCENTLQGIYAGNGTMCIDDVCDLGACCMPTGACAQYVEAQCVAEGGTFRGVGTTCTPNPCPQPTGACCIGGSTCVPGQTLANCTSWPGDWAGPFTPCFTGQCPICDDGDADQDNDVDLDDFDDFQMCLGSPAGVACNCLDMDNDNDVDLDDHSLFQPALTGP